MAASQPKALVFDVFGTCVDWRGSIIREGRALNAERGWNIDWEGLVDAWRGAYQPNMHKVRKGELPWTKLDDLHMMALKDLLPVVYVTGDAAETAELRIQKTYLFPAQSYEIGLSVELQNKKATPVSYHLELSLEGYQDPSQKPGSVFSEKVPQTELLWDVAGKRRSLALEPLLDGKADADDLRGNLRWIGFGSQYFLLAAAGLVGLALRVEARFLELLVAQAAGDVLVEIADLRRREVDQ